MRLSDNTHSVGCHFKTPAARLCRAEVWDDAAMSVAFAKRTVVEGSGGRLVPFGQPGMLEIDAH